MTKLTFGAQDEHEALMEQYDLEEHVWMTLLQSCLRAKKWMLQVSGHNSASDYDVDDDAWIGGMQGMHQI